MTSLHDPSIERGGASWLVELIGPQFSGKSTIADLLALTLEETGSPVLRVETDNYIYGMFPIYGKLKVSGKFRQARRLIRSRWNLIHAVISKIIREGVTQGFIVVHDHVNTHPFREGVYRELAVGAGAKYLSVYVYAPLEVLQERWRSSNISESNARRLGKKYSKFSRLREELDFDLIIDTSSTKPDAAVLKILSRIMPNSDLDVRPLTVNLPTAEPAREPVTAEAKPSLVVKDVQVMKQGDTYLLVHTHRRYHADEVGLRVLSLCDGKNTTERIAELAGTDIETAQKDIEFLAKAGIVEFIGLERAAPA